MPHQNLVNYNRIAKAIRYINDHFKQQPSLDEIASSINLSASHFQRLFSVWAGVSPKKFMQYTSLEYAKKQLKYDQSTLLEAAHETGLSGTSRLHDLFVNIEGMTPGEYKNGGCELTINYTFAMSPFGMLLVASTSKGICHLHFVDDASQALKTLTDKFPQATYHQNNDAFQQNALKIFQQDWSQLDTIRLHLKGTDFQLNVWKSLLQIPNGKVTAYQSIAQKIGHPKSSRAVGSAIGANPIAYLIPCHRVLQKTGALGGYRWGTTRKSAILGWEAATTNQS